MYDDEYVLFINTSGPINRKDDVPRTCFRTYSFTTDTFYLYLVSTNEDGRHLTPPRRRPLGYFVQYV